MDDGILWDGLVTSVACDNACLRTLQTLGTTTAIPNPTNAYIPGCRAPPQQFRRNARYAALGTQKALAAARASS